jgi:hypothetical protein
MATGPTSPGLSKIADPQRKEMVTEARNGARAELVAANRAPLDRLNFLLGDVKDGLGPFLAIFLMSSQHWDAELTRGTGRYNLALGASGACWGLGAALSNGAAGFIVDAFGFSAAVLLFWVGVPERRDMATRVAPETTKPLPSSAIAGA